MMRSVLIALSAVVGASVGHADDVADSSVDIDRKIRGMLIGSAIGDAAGGPVEFQKGEKLDAVLPRFRNRPKATLDAAGLRRLAKTLPLLPYDQLRHDAEPFAHWTPGAAAGTVTDDTRNKILMIDALRRGLRDQQLPIDRRALARELLRYHLRPEVQANPQWQRLCDQWLSEFSSSARWLLGERDPRRALPLERLWCGAGTCCGQMMLPPLAGIYPGKPERAYLAAYELGFFDNGDGKDINSAIVAGLAFAIAQPAPSNDPHARRAAWQAMLDAMRSTDPLRHGEIEFMPRSVNRWIDRGREAADEAGRSPQKLYEAIARRCPAQNAWDASFLLTQAVALDAFCQGEPLAAMHLALDYGQDTDSIAQLLGAMYGALYGPELFPAAMRDAVAQRLEADYGESFDQWVATLARARAIDRVQPVVRPLFDRDERLSTDQ